MEPDIFLNNDDIKQEQELVTTICRGCLSKNRRGVNLTMYSGLFLELAGITISESDGLPQWLCWECAILLQKAVNFKLKLQRVHTWLYDYLGRCAPFPIDLQDPELCKNEYPQLCLSKTMVFDTGGKGTNTKFHKTLEHEKNKIPDSNKFNLPNIIILKENDSDQNEEDLKMENDFSDEDNIPLDEYRTNDSKLEVELPSLLPEAIKQESVEMPEPKKKKRTKKKEEKSKKKKESVEEGPVTKRRGRKPLTQIEELDPTKIRVVVLNPEEQLKQTELESKANLKFPFQCNLCFKGFNFESKYKNHMVKHTPSRGSFKCEVCLMYTPTAYSASVHALTHTRRFECVRCGRRMSDRNSILDHYRSQHEGLLKIFKCTLCGKISNNSKTHRGHMRNHHSGARPTCDQCGKSFINKDSLTEHLLIHQNVKNYRCEQCGAKFRTRTQIKLHQRKHSDTKDYYCVECDVRFKSSHSLKQHLIKSLKHIDVHKLKYKCTRCDKRFDTEPALQHHRSVQHDGVRAHRCPQCPAALATGNSLSKHVRFVHGGGRPPAKHVCDTCGRAFQGKTVLMNHMRTHTGEKPFACAECGRRFAQRTAMNTHVRLVHLQQRRSAKIKPEIPQEVEEPKAVATFCKEETPMVFESWERPPIQSCDEYFRVTAGP